MSFGFKRRLRRLLWPRLRADGHLGFGSRGERLAARFLKRSGYRVLARNYRCPLGEIDLICAHGDMVVFVEVKTRTHDTEADPAEAARPPQWQRIERAAHYFLAAHPAFNGAYRFDLVTVLWPPRGKAVIEHYEHAHRPRWD